MDKVSGEECVRRWSLRSQTDVPYHPPVSMHARFHLKTLDDLRAEEERVVPALELGHIPSEVAQGVQDELELPHVSARELLQGSEAIDQAASRHAYRW